MTGETMRVLIADDEPGMRAVLEKIVERAEGCELAGSAQSGEELLRLYEQTRPQAVLLDVEMPDISGVECARRIQDMDPKTILIFATAHEKYMGEAFSLYAFDYLVKPFRVERALQTLGLARERLTTERNAEALRDTKRKTEKGLGRVMIRHREGVSFVDMDEILLIQREERLTAIYLTGGRRLVTSDGMGDMEKRLSGGSFFRCHKSYIVNLDQIDSVSPYGRWTYIVKLRGTDRDALITHDKYEELEGLFA